MTTLAVEQVAEIRRRPETGRLKPGDLVRAADIGDHPSSGGHEVSGHRRSHAAKSDKTDFAQRRLAASQLCVPSKLARQILGCTSEGRGRAGLVLGHGGSWPSATAPLMRSLRRTHPAI